MNKELEAFCKIKDFGSVGYTLEEYSELVNIIVKALQRLEQIDNAKTSEALECLECFKNGMITDNAICITKSYFDDKFPKIESALIKSQEQEKLLDVIKEYVMPLVSVDDECVWDNEGYQYLVPKKEDLILLMRYICQNE